MDVRDSASACVVNGNKRCVSIAIFNAIKGCSEVVTWNRLTVWEAFVDCLMAVGAKSTLKCNFHRGSSSLSTDCHVLFK